MISTNRWPSLFESILSAIGKLVTRISIYSLISNNLFQAKKL